MVLRNHVQVEDVFRVQDTPMDFNVTEYGKLIPIVSDSTLQLTFKKLLLAKFWYSIKEKDGSYLKKLLNIPLFQLYICMRSNYLYISLIKLQIKIDRIHKQMRIQLSSTKPDIKEIYRNVFQLIFYFALIFSVKNFTLIFYFAKFTYFHKQYIIYINM